ncbi:RHS domain-containing protein [Serratia sp. JSRIV004]|nr:RHS domain-containing protein [Serratia sp. JSRIV004]UAN65673.1 RHS domain-containing protein [Serratia sp. JSRIV006]
MTREVRSAKLVWVRSQHPLVQLLSQGYQSEIYYYLNDHLGPPQELLNGKGQIAWSAAYRAYGNLAVAFVESVPQPLRFQGQYFDAESGLHYNRYRYYSPETARFITPDPIGLAGGLNQTQYVPNPTGWVDPLGLANALGDCPPSIKFINPKTIQYSQDSINPHFSDGNKINDLIFRLKNDPSYINQVEPIRRVRMVDLPVEVQEKLLSQGAHKHSVFSLDNRRLYAAKEAGISQIPTRWATPDDLKGINLVDRFSTKTGGKNIRVRN